MLSNTHSDREIYIQIQGLAGKKIELSTDEFKETFVKYYT